MFSCIFNVCLSVHVHAFYCCLMHNIACTMLSFEINILLLKSEVQVCCMNVASNILTVPDKHLEIFMPTTFLLQFTNR